MNETKIRPEQAALLLRTRNMLYYGLALLLAVTAFFAYRMVRPNEAAQQVAIGNAAREPQSAGYLLGKELFSNNCAVCHNRNMKDDLTGPALGGVLDRWSAYPRSDIYAWIRHSQGLVEAKHPRALEVFKKYKPTVMTDFPTLTDADISAILTYISAVN
jgi:mono/diheme cytochrome c family protein